jgi:eukaryotic-like serine/threonine-protein kinase
MLYRFGPFELDLSRYELRRGEVRLRLARAPMDLLVLLVQRRDILLNREEIAARLWPDPGMVDVDQGINTAIRRIREVLGDDPTKPRFVETVVGKGYRFIAEVKEIRPDSTLVAMPSRPDIQDEPEFEEESPGPRESSRAPERQDQIGETEPKHRSSRWLLPAAIALLLVLAIAYAGWRLHKQKATNYAASLTQITANDSEQRVTAAAISPDGRWIAYADINGVSLRIVQNGETVALKGPENFHADRIAWFPDQTKVLVSGFDTRLSSPQIWTVFITGDAQPQLFRKDAGNGIPSPDGGRILFTADNTRELWTAGTAGEGASLLTADRSGRTFSGMFWSRDGRRVSYLRRLNAPSERDSYESADAVSGKVLATERNITFDSAYALEDGSVFFLRDTPAHMNDDYSLWVVNINAANGAFISAPRQVASLDHGRAFGLTGSEDGRKLSIVIERGQPHVYVGMLHQPGPTLVNVQRLTYDTRTDYPHSWLPDNQTVVFESNRSGLYRLYKQRLQDHTAQELSTGTGQAVLPQVTPDGKWILYAMKPHVVPSPEDKLFRIPVGGGTPEQVPIGGRLEEFECPSIGTGCVLRETEGDKALVYYALDPVAGKGRELARTSWLPHVIEDWCVSPDGSAVALASHDAGNPRIRIVPFNKGPGRKERELPVSGFGKLWGISWSADGKGWYVAAATQVGTSILYVNQQGDIHVLRDMPLGSWGVPSPDGSKLAFVDQAVDSNVWMWQLVGR